MTWQLAISVIIIGAAFLFFIIAQILDKKQHIALKLFFLFGALFIILSGTNYASHLAVDNSASTGVKETLDIIYRINLYAMIIFTAYWTLYYIFILIMHIRQYGK